jgi:hypothetical protein
MREWAKQNLPKYLVDKASGGDEQEVDALPPGSKSTFIHGTDEEAAQIIAEHPELGDAARDLLYDLRGMAEQHKKRKS